MYLHLGQDVVVRMSEVVGIFDMENTSTSRFTKEFLRQATHEMEVVTVSYEMPKSFVLCERDGKKTLYIFGGRGLNAFLLPLIFLTLCFYAKAIGGYSFGE